MTISVFYHPGYAAAFASYIHAPADPAVLAECPDGFDLILIDGRARLYCAHFAIQNLWKPKTTILIHDFRPRRRYWPILEDCRVVDAIESGRTMVAVKPRDR